MRSCAIHVHKHSIEAMLLQQCREVTADILSITPWLPTYMGQSLIRCNSMRIYPPANDVCQDAAFLFKDRPILIPWVYGEAWETSSVKVWVLTSFGVWQIDLSLA